MASPASRPHLDERASQETLASLAHLDPAPIESPYDEADDETWRSSSDPSQKSATSSFHSGSTTASVGLNGGHGAIYYRALLLLPLHNPSASS